MYVKKTKTSKGRVFLQIVEGYRNEKGYATNRVIRKLGYQDELDPLYNGDAFSHFSSELKSSNDSERLTADISFKANRTMTKDVSSLRNAGYLALKSIYNKLKIKDVSKVLSTKYDTEADINEVFQFLLYSKIIDAASKLSSYARKDKYFENFTFSEDQMYRCLSYIGNSWEQIKDYIFRTTNSAYGLDLSKTYYDGTNFFFEIDYETEFQRKGPSKENRREPLVSIGLLLDANYLPIDICIYPGNESEKPHFTKVINDMKAKNKIIGKTVYIADKGLNCGSNVYNALKNGDGYIYSQTVKGASEKVKQFIVNDYGFHEVYDEYEELEYKIKDFIVDDAEITFVNEDGKKITHRCVQKQVITWSAKYAKKSKIERDKQIMKAHHLIKNPKAWDKSKVGDAASYVKKVVYDKNGVIVEDKSLLELDIKKIKSEERLDGFYMIVTSELNMTGEEIVKTYRNTSNTERAFRVEKLYLKLRPVYLSRVERIKAHVLISYLSLLMLKILERKILKDEFPIEEIIDSLREYECAMISPNIYFFFKYNSVVEKLGKIASSNVSIETQSLAGIKKLFNNL